FAYLVVVRRTRAARPDVVPRRLRKVRAGADMVRVARSPLVHHLGVVLDGDLQRVIAAEEREDLAADLRHRLLRAPRVVEIRARQAQAVFDGHIPLHARTLRLSGCRSSWSNVAWFDRNGPIQVPDFTKLAGSGATRATGEDHAAESLSPGPGAHR